jgi:N6-L-threonylcarbamoyladenine synthase
MSETLTILSIETSCDETAAAVIRYDESGLTVLSSVVSSQIELHAKYGGVVPNLAAREHVKNIIPVITETLDTAKLTQGDIDAIAVTQGPGLIPALLIGVSAAKTLALAWQKPLMGIHHIEGHIYANFIGNFQFPISNFQTNNNFQISNEGQNSRSGIQKSEINSKIENRKSIFPLLALVVSGGHTQIVLMNDHFQYEILGETRDDAVGEAFDKAARLLGLPYPGGPAIAARAANHDLRLKIDEPEMQDSKIPARPTGGENRKSTFLLPRPMIDSPDLDFSFSGLKTAVLYLVKENESRKTDADFIDTVAYEFQESAVDVLIAKTRKAIEAYSPKTVIIAGGVSANIRLRERMQEMVDGINADFVHSGLTAENDSAVKPLKFIMPEFKYSLDNAAMIGAAAAIRFARLTPSERDALRSNALTLEPNANLPLG